MTHPVPTGSLLPQAITASLCFSLCPYRCLGLWVFLCVQASSSLYFFPNLKTYKCPQDSQVHKNAHPVQSNTTALLWVIFLCIQLRHSVTEVWIQLSGHVCEDYNCTANTVELQCTLIKSCIQYSAQHTMNDNWYRGWLWHIISAALQTKLQSTEWTMNI